MTRDELLQVADETQTHVQGYKDVSNRTLWPPDFTQVTCPPKIGAHLASKKDACIRSAYIYIIRRDLSRHRIEWAHLSGQPAAKPEIRDAEGPGKDG